MTSHSIGIEAEKLALDYLKQQGLKLIKQNFHSRQGEIDLIMEDKNTLVFIEVRYRQSAKFGSAEESVSYQKQQRIIHTAQVYLQQSKHYFTGYRFDVVAIQTPLSNKTINWIQDAFQLS
jgi:putative endonuclease